MKVLIIKLSSLGDIVHAVPAVQYLRRNAKESLEIHWLVNDNLAPLVEATGVADRTILFDRSAWKNPWNIFSNTREFFRTVRRLRKEKYDIALDLQCLFRSSIIPFLAGVPRRAGFDRAREGSHLLLNEFARTRGKGLHAVEENMAVMQSAFSLSLPDDPGKYVFMIKDAPEKEKKVESLLKERSLDPKNLILVNPNSRWESKKWGLERYEALIRKISDETRFFVGIIGSREEKESVRPLEAIGERVHVLAGETDLIELILLLKKSLLLITNDSGPMHLSSSAGCKTLALFGSTSAERTGPFWEKEIIKSNVPCSPCFKRACPLKGDEYMCCMHSISVDDVFQAAMKLVR